MSRARQHHVYFIRPVGMDGPVKIGCSVHTGKRLQDLTVWSPYRLEIVATIPGDTALERRFHHAFLADRLHSEWFAASSRLTQVMAEVAAGVFDVDGLPGPKRLPNKTRMGNGWTEEVRLIASMGHRLRILRKRDVAVPENVRAAMSRYSASKYWRKSPRDPADAACVQEWLTGHGYAPKPIPAPQHSEAA